MKTLAMAAEARKLGAQVEEGDDWIRIHQVPGLGEDRYHDREELDWSGDQVAQLDRGSEANHPAVGGDDGLEAHLEADGLLGHDRCEGDVTVGKRCHAHIGEEELAIEDAQGRGLAVEHGNLRGLHHIRSFVTLGSLKEEEDLDVAEERKAKAKTARSG